MFKPGDRSKPLETQEILAGKLRYVVHLYKGIWEMM